MKFIKTEISLDQRNYAFSKLPISQSIFFSLCDSKNYVRDRIDWFGSLLNEFG